MPLLINGVRHYDGEPVTVNGVMLDFVTAERPNGSEQSIVWRNVVVLELEQHSDTIILREWIDANAPTVKVLFN